MVGLTIPVVITVFADRTFRLRHQDAPGAGAAEEGREDRKGLGARRTRSKVGTVTEAQVREIATQKMPDLNAASVEAAIKSIKGTARSMGLDVVA